MPITVDDWLNPIRDDAPGGDDVSLGDGFDRIREARRADDASLSQGDWQHELKVANWREVIDLAGRILSTQSKDLQAAVWLGEALIAQHHLDGARAACELLAQLQERYWDTMHPRIEDGDLDERSAKLAWFIDYGAQALGRLPLTAGNPGMGLTDWQISREVDNLSRQNAQAYQAALDEGKPTGEVFDKALDTTPNELLLQRLDDANAGLAAFAQFKAVSDARFGRDGPSFARLEDSFKRIQQILAKVAKAKGLLQEVSVTTPDNAAPDPSADSSAPAPVASGAALQLTGNDAASKAAAIRALTEIAAWFHRAEPHSPVPFLLDRAIAWADMPLDAWLAEVVSDPNTLTGIRTRIGLPG